MTRRTVSSGWAESTRYPRYLFIHEIGGGISTANHRVGGESEFDYLARTIVVLVVERLLRRERPLDNRAHNYGLAMLSRLTRGYYALGMTEVNRDALRALLDTPASPGALSEVWRELHEAVYQLYREIWYFQAD